MIALAGLPDNTVDVARPDDEEVITLLAAVYDVTEYVAIRWLMAMDLPLALVRDQGIEPN